MSNIIGKLTDVEDFKRIYTVFSREPYKELITPQEVEEIFAEYQENGWIFGAHHFNDKQVGECVGLVAIERGVQAKMPVKYEKEKKVAYLADVAVLEQYRERGLGAQLMLYAIMFTKELGYDTLYMRTLQEGSMSKPIALKLGFTQIPDIIQDVERKRTDGTTRALPNIFLDIDLRNLNKDTLKRGLAMTRAEITRKAEEKGMEIGE